MPNQSTGQKNEIKLGIMANQITNIENDISEIKDSIRDMNNKIDHTYVTKQELDQRLKPVENLAANIGKVILAVVTAIVLGVMGLLGLRSQ
jgi:peptidoglycan hydrolase CwlO-like protein